MLVTDPVGMEYRHKGDSCVNVAGAGCARVLRFFVTSCGEFAGGTFDGVFWVVVGVAFAAF